MDENVSWLFINNEKFITLIWNVKIQTMNIHTDIFFDFKAANEQREFHYITEKRKILAIHLECLGIKNQDFF